MSANILFNFVNETIDNLSKLSQLDFDFLLAGGSSENVKWKAFLKTIMPTQYTEYIDSLDDRQMHFVLEHVASSPRVPLFILAELLCHGSSDVRLAISDNPSTSKLLLFLLATDEDPDVRHELASNPRIPIEILDKLSCDENPFVSHQARKTLTKLHNINKAPVKIHSMQYLFSKLAFG